MAFINYVFILFSILSIATIFFLVHFKKPARKTFRRFLIALQSVVLVLMIGKVVLLPDLSTLPTTGEFRYASRSIQLTDESRKEDFKSDGSYRKLSVLLFYPIVSHPNDKRPLVVFSHGGMSFETSNLSLYKELASHGYIVASIGHTYHALTTKIDGKTIFIDGNFQKELNTENSHANIAQSFAYYQKWMKLRTDDIRFVLDTFLKNRHAVDFASTLLIDPNRIGLIGHSLGGSACLGVARMRSDIKAVIALESPYFCDMLGIDGNDFIWNNAPYDAAIFNIYSDSGMKLVEKDHKYEQNKKWLLRDEKTDFFYIEGSNHFTLTDMVRLSPLLSVFLGGYFKKSGVATLKKVNELSVHFFDTHLS